MGLLARRWEQRSTLQDFLNDDDPFSMPTPSGIRVNSRVALSLTTIWRCIDLLSSAVSQAPWDVFLKVGNRSFEQYTKPDWLSMPNPSDETYTLADYFSEVAFSILTDGNYFTWVVGTVFDPQALVVCPPQQVTVKPGPRFEVKDNAGHVVAVLGPRDMLHGWWIRPPGSLRGIAPLEALRRSIGGAVAADEFGSRFFGQGAALSFGVEVPGSLTAGQKLELAESLKRKHAGLGNSHAIGILTGGGKFVSGLAPTPEQSQMLDTRKFSVEDLCRPYGVPPGLVGSQQPGHSSYASSQTTDAQFKERAVLPLALRIEAQHNRLLTVPDGVPLGATMQIKANLDYIARTDLLQRYQAYEAGILGGFLTPNDARKTEDLPPADGGDFLYMQQQMQPITNRSAVPAATPTPEPPVLRSIEPAQPVTINNFTAGEDAVRAVMPEPMSREDMMAMMVSGMAALPVPPAPIVNVTPPGITVNVPDSPAPIVNVAAPAVTVQSATPDVHLHVPSPGARKLTRDRAGNITGIEPG